MFISAASILGLIGLLCSVTNASPIEQRATCPVKDAKTGAKLLVQSGLVQFCPYVLKQLVPTTTVTTTLPVSTVLSSTTQTSYTVSTSYTTPPPTTVYVPVPTVYTASYVSANCPPVSMDRPFPSYNAKRALESLGARAGTLPSPWTVCALTILRDSCELALYSNTFATSTIVKTVTPSAPTTTVTTTFVTTITFGVVQQVPPVTVLSTTTTPLVVCASTSFAAVASAGCFSFALPAGAPAHSDLLCNVQAVGASGGSDSSFSGGTGANVLATLKLNADGVYQYAVGSQAANGMGAGGGGATWFLNVSVPDSEYLYPGQPLMIAAGGGGAGVLSAGGNAYGVDIAQDGRGGGLSLSTVCGPGGGAGYFYDGADSVSSCGQGGRMPRSYLGGGAANGDATSGGFGGGGEGFNGGGGGGAGVRGGMAGAGQSVDPNSGATTGGTGGSGGISYIQPPLLVSGITTTAQYGDGSLILTPPA